MMSAAEKLARDSMRLAKGMQSASLIAHSHLLLGKIYSSPDSSLVLQKPRSDRAIEELQCACSIIDPSFPNDTVWRAHAELSFLFKMPCTNAVAIM
jgi:hypothetical protein